MRYISILVYLQSNNEMVCHNLSAAPTGEVALLHLLWFQSIGRAVIDDIDPISGAVLIHLSFKDIEKDMER